jgi:hypothetical protein
MVFWLVGTIAIFVYVLTSRLANEGSSVGLLIFFYMASLLSAIFVPIYCIIKKAKKLAEQKEAEFNVVIERENSHYFRSRDIRWTVGKRAAWLTIELDYIARGMNQNAGGFTPNPTPFNPSNNMAIHNQYPNTTNGQNMAKPDSYGRI